MTCSRRLSGGSVAPGNATVWYETVLAFLAEHLLGQEWQRPELV
jgi:hypothetical protein